MPDVNLGNTDRRRRSRATDRAHSQGTPQVSAKRYALSSFLIAATLSFGWEMAQMFAYTHRTQVSITLLFCSLAAMGDGVYTALLYWVGKAASADERWIFKLTVNRALVIMLWGFVTAVVIERLGIYMGLWTYAGPMPVLPVLNVGILPVLQLMLLPLIVFGIMRRVATDKRIPGYEFCSTDARFC